MTTEEIRERLRLTGFAHAPMHLEPEAENYPRWSLHDWSDPGSTPVGWLDLLDGHPDSAAENQARATFFAHAAADVHALLGALATAEADAARLRAALREAHSLLDGYDGLPGREDDARRVYGALLALRAALDGEEAVEVE
jgi:hypothetical protein